MTESPSSLVPKRKQPWLIWWLGLMCLVVASGVFYIRARPLVFNESFWQHAHCMAQSGPAFRMYAEDNSGCFPNHTNGYGDALLLLVPRYAPWSLLTGPGGYDSQADRQWKQSEIDIPEIECGRVYVQGLTKTNNPDIAILFDKVPTPGGDHCHGLRRLIAPLCRDVLYLSGSKAVIGESTWAEFSSHQIELLVNDGYDRVAAEQLYGEKGRRR